MCTAAAAFSGLILKADALQRQEQVFPSLPAVLNKKSIAAQARVFWSKLTQQSLNTAPLEIK